MIGLSGLAAQMRRCRRMSAYKLMRAEVEAMTDADLADIGLKRYQLGHVARAKALR